MYLYISTKQKWNIKHIRKKLQRNNSRKVKYQKRGITTNQLPCTNFFFFCLFLACALLNNFNYAVKTKVFFTISAPSPALCTFAVYYTQMSSSFHYSQFFLFSLYCLSMNGKKTSEVVSASSPHTHIVPQQPDFAVSGKTVNLPALAWSTLSSNEILSKLTAKR